MVQALLCVLIGIGKRVEREASDDGKETDEVELPEDLIDWRRVRWVSPKVRGKSACFRDLSISHTLPQKPWMLGKTDFHRNEPHPLDEHSWKATSRARRQFARHLRRSWGRMEREAA
jgi:hypothetical protein